MQAELWLKTFLRGNRQVSTLFTDDALWRDYLAFEWDLQTHEGTTLADKAKTLLPYTQADVSIASLETLTPSEFVVEFMAPNGHATAYIQLQGRQCHRLFTALHSLHDDKRSLSQANGKDKPFVLIVGAGQSGLALAARLQQLKIPYLVIEKNRRIGDNWRQRYASLVLHDPVWVNHLPFKRFPQDWPVYTPKDRMGDWLEEYAQDLDLQVQLHTELQAANFNEQQQAWQLQLQQQGAIKPLQATHLVLALGTSGFRQQPKFSGYERFKGSQIHSSQYRSGAAYRGQQVAIVGATNSAHDIAMDLLKHDAKPILIQRSSTHVVPHEVYVKQILGSLYAPQLADLERADLLSLAKPLRDLEAMGKSLFQQVQLDWHDFYEALRRKGFAVDFAEDGSGIIGKYRRSASGYYIDVGGSQQLIEGAIDIISGLEIASLQADSVVFTDASKLKADSIIYATGFGSMENWLTPLLGAAIAAKIGRCWGYGSGYRNDPGPWLGELRNMWKPTAQQGLWFMGGNLAQARIYSKYLALQLQARYRQR